MPPNNSQPSNQPPTSPPPDSPPPILESDIKNTLDADERVINVIYRHIIGIFYIYFVAFSVVAVMLAFIILIFPDLFSGLSRESNLLLAAGAVFGLALIFFILFIATYIYRQNKIVVTNQNIIQVLQNGLFIRKVSRLDYSDVEDVTAEHRGILSNMFNFGTLNIETSGEQKNFIFPYCPDPNKYADLILDLRQAREAEVGGRTSSH
jgi:uncharacterized membrane protein YdbT with pleckstrin-like domain